MSVIRTGKYRHFKGHDYWVMALSTHSETEEKLVVYCCLYGKYDWWVRPLDNFLATVEVNGEPVKRYEYIGPLTEKDQQLLQANSGVLPPFALASATSDSGVVSTTIPLSSKA